MSWRGDRRAEAMFPKCDALDLRSGIAEIPDLPREVLTEHWAKIYGYPPPKGLGRRLLEYAVAYDLQSREHGGLKPAARRKLRQLTGAGRNATRQPSPAAKAKALAPGSRLVREWRGRIYTVDVVENEFLYRDQRYGSLSELARAITGARWSGPRFFGL